MFRKASLIGAILLTFSAAVSADIYTWVDAEGVVHYEDQPVAADAKVSAIRSARTNREAASASLAASTAARAANSEQFYANRESRREANEEATAAAELKKANCAKARQKLNELAGARRMFKLNEAGERVYLDNDEKVAARANVQKSITESCS